MLADYNMRASMGACWDNTVVERFFGSLKHGRLFRQGLLVNLTNPKALIFIAALVPQYLIIGPQPW